MKICMLLRKQFPDDIRVEKEARALQRGGHEITLLCRGHPDEPARETIDSIDVIRADVHELSALRRRPATLRYLATNVHPRWETLLRYVVRTRGIDAIHVHDLPMVGTALAVGEDYGLPVVADFHENYPEAIRQWRRMDDREDVLTSPNLLAEYLFRPISRWKSIERDCVLRSAHVLATTEEARSHYLWDCDGAPSKVSIVSNTVDLDTFDADADPMPVAEINARAAEGTWHSAELDEGDFVLAYVGKYAPHRGLEAVVRALPGIAEEVPNAKLLIVGAPGTERYGGAFDDLVGECGVEGRVVNTGWVDFDDVPSYMAAGDVCLVPHAKNPHTDTTVPHKLFQYMALSKPVITSNADPLARMMDETDAGLVATAGDPGAFAEAAVSLADPDRREELGANGRRAVEERYNWAIDAERLRTIYDRL